MEEKKITIGGQAVIEGVMMRGPELTATAVRTPEGKIEISSRPVNSISDRYPILKKPLLRGFLLHMDLYSMILLFMQECLLQHCFQ